MEALQPIVFCQFLTLQKCYIMYLSQEKLKVMVCFIAGLWFPSQEIWVLSPALQSCVWHQPGHFHCCASVPLLPGTWGFLSPEGCWGMGHKRSCSLGTIPALTARHQELLQWSECCCMAWLALCFYRKCWMCTFSNVVMWDIDMGLKKQEV